MNKASSFAHRFVGGDRDPSSPVLLLLHGTGGNENDLMELGRELHPCAALLSPRGKILEHGMPRFFRRLAEGVFDQEDLIFRTHELAGFIRAATEEYMLEDRSFVAVGYSNGANIAASLLLLEPGILRGAVLLRGMLPLTPPVLPQLTGTEVMMSNGTRDPLISSDAAERLAEMLRQAGAEVTHHWSDSGHHLYPEELDVAKQWLADRFPARHEAHRPCN